MRKFSIFIKKKARLSFEGIFALFKVLNKIKTKLMFPYIMSLTWDYWVVAHLVYMKTRTDRIFRVGLGKEQESRGLITRECSTPVAGA